MVASGAVVDGATLAASDLLGLSDDAHQTS